MISTTFSQLISTINTDLSKNIDVTNVLQSETSGSVNNITYTATQDCYIIAKIKTGDSVGNNVNIKLNGVTIYGAERIYNGGYLTFLTPMFKNGDVLTITGTSSETQYYTVYGVR